MSYRNFLLALFFFLPGKCVIAQDQIVSFEKTSQSITLVENGIVSSLYVNPNDFPGVVRAVKDLQKDLERVTQVRGLITNETPKAKTVVIIGTIGKSPLIDQLIGEKKIRSDDVNGKWETFLIQTLKNPLPGVEAAVVIAGSDKRGTIFGIYELSRQIGVSPWYWWADVPVTKKPAIYIKPGRYVQGEPKVKYRGIFINDEEPALGRWAVEKYGGFNHEFYEKVFELILRMKGNYLWPAMWWASFNSDDTLNARLADEYGIVMGTTHHEPMNRAHAEWRKTGKGPWNYETNEAVLRQFWKEGIDRIDNHETIVSLGMRGDGDLAMSDETNIALLERIVSDQRKMIADVTQKKITETPQLWALYKEVQDYYDRGMRAPDDVTLLLCDDNWGNIRKLNKVEDSLRSGGYGIYYHFDYVGGPRNYKWVNTNAIARVWEQMHLAYRYGANRIWIVNVGDIKPMEFPTQFFMDYAWNPEQWNNTNLEAYPERWSADHFGKTHAKEIGKLITDYSRFNARRKPELLSADTYSLVNFREAENVVTRYEELVKKAETIATALPAEYQDAYFQLVLHPVKASANLNALWIAVAKNRLYAKQGRASTNDYGSLAKRYFEIDAELSRQYNKEIAGGKWNHMMDQTHISYTYWQQPEKDLLPETTQVDVSGPATMGVAIEGNPSSWPGQISTPRFPEFDNFHQQKYFVDIFNRGKGSFQYSAQSSASWVTISKTSGVVEKEERLFVSIDWKKIPSGKQQSSLVVRQEGGASVTIEIIAFNHSARNVTGFVESNGYISMDASSFSRKVESNGLHWELIEDIGRTGAGLTSFPVTASAQNVSPSSSRLEFDFHIFSTANITVHALLSPTLNFNGSNGLRFGVSLDDEAVQILNMHEGMNNAVWEKWVADNIIEKISKHEVKAGNHVLKFWMVDPGIVLQKIIIETKEVPGSYLGPPESFRAGALTQKRASESRVNRK
jgi:hypothetical protein